MSLIIFIEISIFSRGCYEHATPPYSTESPESRDKVSRRDIATSVTMPAESGTRVNVRGQFVYALRKIKHGNTPLLLNLCLLSPKNGWFTEWVRQALSQRDIRPLSQ